MTDAPSHLQRLNPEQYDAVTTVEGPLLILAGAGSGKTRVLTRRIAQFLHLGIEPEEILAVTFTNKAASEMKERVIELVGDVGSKVWVSTFHSSCARILRQDIEALDIWTKRFAIYDDDDQRRIVKALVEDYGYDTKFVGETLSLIDHYKNDLKGVDDVIREKRHSPNTAVVRLWRGYEEALEASDALDFNDLIGVAVRLFTECPEVLEKWRQRFRYIMVDEYQDTNRGQYRLLRLLADGHRNLAVVGDDDQSIYGFRGADIANILGFERDYPEAKVIRLEQNYRSTGNILSVANAVVSKNKGRLDKKLWTAAGDGEKVQLLVNQTARDEAKRVARAVKKIRMQGYTWSDMAVIYRTNSMAKLFEQELMRVRVPYKVVGGRKFYERREVRDLLAYMRLITNPADDAAFLRVVNVPRRGVGAKTLSKLREDAGAAGQPLLRSARIAGGGTSVGAKGLKGFVDIIDDISAAARVQEPQELLAHVIDVSGYLAMLEAEVEGGKKDAHAAKQRVKHLQELTADVGSFTPPPEAITPLERLTAWLDRVALYGQDEEVPDGGEVTLMTVHNSKGLEYPVVFVVQMIEGSFPHAKSIDRGVDEERRLAYVAFTRAQKRLIITRSMRSYTLGQGDGSPAEASRFLHGIPEDACFGDMPGGEPEPDKTVARTLDDVKRNKLQAFLAHRREEPKGDHVLIEVEDISQLQRGRKVHVEPLGIGVIRERRSDRLRVEFGSKSRWIPLRGAELHLVADG